MGRVINLSKEATSDTIPLLIQWDERWGYHTYGTAYIGNAGCAPTCLSMILLYLTHQSEYTPLKIAAYAEENQYYIPNVGTEWGLLTEGCEDFGIKAQDVVCSEYAIKEALDKKLPVLCSMNPGDFTMNGHFIILAGYDQEGLIVNDPNSRINSNKRWSFETVLPQVKAIWAYDIKPEEQESEKETEGITEEETEEMAKSSFILDKDIFTKDGLLFPDSNIRNLEEKDLKILQEKAAKSDDYTYGNLISFAINEIYARKGFFFSKNGQYAQWYGSHKWYQDLDKRDMIPWEEFSYQEQANIMLLVDAETSYITSLYG